MDPNNVIQGSIDFSSNLYDDFLRKNFSDFNNIIEHGI